MPSATWAMTFRLLAYRGNYIGHPPRKCFSKLKTGRFEGGLHDKREGKRKKRKKKGKMRMRIYNPFLTKPFVGNIEILQQEDCIEDFEAGKHSTNDAEMKEEEYGGWIKQTIIIKSCSKGF